MIRTKKKPKRLLIVDDDRSLRQILTWGFEDLGYQVWAAATVREAMAAARRVAFDCALLDYRLPDGDGHTLSRALARRRPDLRIVLMSGGRSAAIAEIGNEPVALGFVDKPVRLRRLAEFFAVRPSPFTSGAG